MLSTFVAVRSPSLSPIMPRSVSAALLLVTACAGARSTPQETTVVTPRTAVITTSTGTSSVQLTNQDRTQGATIRVAPDLAWKLIPSVFADFALPVTTYLTDTRQIVSANNRARGRLGTLRMTALVSCGADMLGDDKANSYEVTLAVSTAISPTADTAAALVSTLVTATARPMATSGDLLHCASTGQLEKRIANAVLVKSASR